MITFRKKLFILGLWLLITLIGRQIFAQTEKKIFVAFSMKEAQERMETALLQGQDFREQVDLFYLGGISKPTAIVYEPESDDWILVGERDEKSSILTLDDWVVALRARFLHGDEDPGVTIEPGEDAFHATRQSVRFFGGVEKTNFGKVCLDADWLMKKIGLGLENVPTKKLRTYYELAQEEAKGAGEIKRDVLSRFWFLPIISRVNVLDSDNVILLERFKMGVFTELLAVKINDEPITDLSDFAHYPSEEFARSFSENYTSLRETWEVLNTLQGLTRLAALAKGLTQAIWKPEIHFWLSEYPVALVDTLEDKGVEVLSNSSTETGITISGGAQLAALAMRLGGDASAFRELVLISKRDSNVLVWEFQIDLIDDRPVGVKLPPGLSDPNQLWPLWTQANFLSTKERYDDAIRLYDEILHYVPECYDVYLNRGVAYDNLELIDQSLADYSSAIKLDPKRIEAYNNRGLLYYDQGFYDEALVDFGKALELNPKAPLIYNNRGKVYIQQKLYDLAIADYNKALEFNPQDAIAYYNLGSAYRDQNLYEESLLNYNKALEFDPGLIRAYYSRGLVYIEKRLYLKALIDFNQVLDMDPRLAFVHFEKALTLEMIDGLHEALEAYKATISFASLEDSEMIKIAKERMQKIESLCESSPLKCKPVMFVGSTRDYSTGDVTTVFKPVSQTTFLGAIERRLR
jgi:tetratricopeptide (TPR) repeat protein